MKSWYSYLNQSVNNTHYLVEIVHGEPDQTHRTAFPFEFPRAIVSLKSFFRMQKECVVLEGGFQLNNDAELQISLARVNRTLQPMDRVR